MNELKIKRKNKSIINNGVIQNQTTQWNLKDLKTNNRDTSSKFMNKTDTRSNFNSTTSPTLIKIEKTQDMNELLNDRKEKTNENEVKYLIDKYYEKGGVFVTTEIKENESNFVVQDFKRETENTEKLIYNITKEKGNFINVDNTLNIKSQVLDSNNRISQEEQLFDPVTEGNCSFINNVSLNNSNFLEDLENKENEVVLCISSLEIDNNKKLTYILSEEKLFNKEADTTISNTSNTENNKLLSSLTQLKEKFCTRKKVIICIIIFIICSAILGVVTILLK